MDGLDVVDDILHHGELHLVGHVLLGDRGVVEDPLVVEGFLGGHAVVGFVGKHTFDEDLGLTGDELPLWLGKGEFTRTDLVEDLSMVLAFEGRLATEEDEHDHATTPNITLLIVHSI